MIVCIWCISSFGQSTSCNRAPCPRQGPWDRGLCGVLAVTAERLWKNRSSCCATLNGNSQVEGTFSERVQNKLEMWIVAACFTPTRDFEFYCGFERSTNLSATHQQFQGGCGPKAAFLSPTFVFLNKGCNQTNVQTHWHGHWFPKEEVCMRFGNYC